MLMLTSHFLRQVWEFPICGPAPAQCHQDNSNFGSSSSYLLCSPSCSWYHFSHSHEVLGVKSKPAFCLEQDEAFWGRSRNRLVNPACRVVVPQWTGSKVKETRAHPSTWFLFLLQVLSRGGRQQTALESAARFLSGLRLESVRASAVMMAARQQHKRRALYVPSMPFQGVHCTFLLLVFGDCPCIGFRWGSPSLAG